MNQTINRILYHKKQCKVVEKAVEKKMSRWRDKCMEGIEVRKSPVL